MKTRAEKRQFLVTENEFRTVQWIRKRYGRRDAERAGDAAEKIWRYIAAWEIVREADGEWVSAPAIAEDLKVSGRQARRLMRFLEASGFCEYGDKVVPNGRPGANAMNGIRVRFPA